MVEDISASDRWVIPASVLGRIPGCAGGEAPLSVHLLHGGRNVNRTLRIDTRVGRFVLRQRIQEGPRPGADPLGEVACHRAAAAAGVAPAVLDAAPDGSWILMDYVEGGMWTPPRLQAPEGLRTLGACLQRLGKTQPGRLPHAGAADGAPRQRVSRRHAGPYRVAGRRRRHLGCLAQGGGRED